MLERLRVAIAGPVSVTAPELVEYLTKQTAALQAVVDQLGRQTIALESIAKSLIILSAAVHDDSGIVWRIGPVREQPK